MDNYHWFYDFKIGQENRGFYTITSQPGLIIMLAKFEINGKTTENRFDLQHDGHKVTAFKAGGGNWRAMDGYGENHYPTSAYPLLLPQVETVFRYQAIDDSTGVVTGERVLNREGDHIVETSGGKIKRRFKLREGRPVEINWGGPRSTLRASFQEAAAGSPYEGDETSDPTGNLF